MPSLHSLFPDYRLTKDAGRALVRDSLILICLGAIIVMGVMIAADLSLGRTHAMVSYDERGRIQCHAVEIPQQGEGESFRYEKCPSDWRRFGQSEVGPNWKPPR